MLMFQDAYETAQRLLGENWPRHTVDLVIARCEEIERAWAFSYNARSFIEDGVLSHSLVDNGPVIVPKSGHPAFFGSVFGAIDDQPVD